jgi:uncharacterized membrane protein YfcA
MRARRGTTRWDVVAGTLSCAIIAALVGGSCVDAEPWGDGGRWSVVMVVALLLLMVATERPEERR